MRSSTTVPFPHLAVRLVLLLLSPGASSSVCHAFQTTPSQPHRHREGVAARRTPVGTWSSSASSPTVLVPPFLSSSSNHAAGTLSRTSLLLFCDDADSSATESLPLQQHPRRQWLGGRRSWLPSSLSRRRGRRSCLAMTTTESAVTASDESSSASSSLWGRFRSALPPAEERQKLLPLALMFFCILFNYTILRDTKDVLMLTAPKSGAEVIPFLKTYVNLPTAIAFTGVYAKLTDSMDLKNVFYAIVIPFLTFFATFAGLIYPHRDFLHPHGMVDALASYLPASFGAPLAIVRNWSFALFYVMAEMWGSVVASLLFWGLANEVTTVDEAKKYYPLFGLGANVALIFSGQYVKLVSKMRANLAPGVDSWAFSLNYLMGAVVASGGVLLAAYKYIQDKILSTKEAATEAGDELSSSAATAKPVKKKVKMTMRESFKFLLSSKYIRNLAVLVVSYGMCINIVEVSWKAKLKQAFPDPNDYSSFMGNFSSAMGTVTLMMMLVGRSIFQKYGWRTAALVTPTMIGLTGLAFFGINIFSGAMVPAAAFLGTTPLMLAVLIGAAQNIMSKSSKYSLFDPCKEMAYIPLDKESKTKGKAAIDVIGGPLGKSGGALIQQILIFGVGSLAAATPYLAVILSVVVFSWFRSANSLATQFNQAMSQTDDGDAASTAEPAAA